MTLEEVRNEIDEIDTNMKPLFLRRMKYVQVLMRWIHR